VTQQFPVAPLGEELGTAEPFTPPGGGNEGIDAQLDLT
jgi:hypothetical protein